MMEIFESVLALPVVMVIAFVCMFSVYMIVHVSIAVFREMKAVHFDLSDPKTFFKKVFKKG